MFCNYFPVLSEQFERNTSDLYICIKLDQYYSGTNCVKEAFDLCFHQVKGSVNRLETGNGDKDTQNSIVYAFDSGDGYQPALLDSFWGINGKGNEQAEKTVSYVLETSTIVWLGGAADSNEWNQPSPTSLLGKLLKRINLKKNNVVNFMERSQEPTCQASPQLKCSNYMTFNSTHKSHLRHASSSCAPTFIVPGFMKAGTTFLYETLGKHPQVLKALRGVAFKETGCYLEPQMTEKKRDQRMQCFPFLENGEAGHFAFGDGTVYYNNRVAIPSYIQHDNANARAVFVVRNPIDRLISHFKFAYKSLPKYLQDVNSLVGIALKRDGGIYVYVCVCVCVCVCE